jgi:hypothetical protein
MKKSKVQKLREAKERELRKEAGYFDGRFSPRVEESKKKYSRKRKHKRNSI